VQSVSELKAPFVSNDARVFNIALTAYRLLLRKAAATSEAEERSRSRKNRRNIFADSSQPFLVIASRRYRNNALAPPRPPPQPYSNLYTHDIIKQPLYNIRYHTHTHHPPTHTSTNRHEHARTHDALLHGKRRLNVFPYCIPRH